MPERSVHPNRKEIARYVLARGTQVIADPTVARPRLPAIGWPENLAPEPRCPPGTAQPRMIDCPKVRHRGARRRHLDLRVGARMGTSVKMIDRTYGHLARDSEQAIRARLDARAERSGD